MLYQKFVRLFIFFRELIMTFLFGKIEMVNYCNTFYPIKFFVPYMLSFFLEYFKISYVYKVDNIYSYIDYNYDVKMLPPIISFKIDGVSILDNIKNYKGNVPMIFILYNNKLLHPKNTEISYFDKGVIKNKKIENIQNFNNLQDVFY